MSQQLLDRQYTLKILKMLATPWKKMDAYKLGIIDGDGNVLKKSFQLKTRQEKEAYNFLTRLIVILKKAIEKQEKRGDFNLTKALSPALWLVREHNITGNKTLSGVDLRYQKLYDLDITFVEEEIEIKNFIKEEGAVGGAPVNNVGGGGIAGTSQETGGPVIKKKNIDQFRKIARRSMPKLKTLVPTEG